jgi:hypothetical protein
VADPAPSPNHDPDDETIEYTPHRQQIAAAGRLAKAEQARLEKLLGLDNGRTPRQG